LLPSARASAGSFLTIFAGVVPSSGANLAARREHRPAGLLRTADALHRAAGSHADAQQHCPERGALEDALVLLNLKPSRVRLALDAQESCASHDEPHAEERLVAVLGVCGFCLFAGHGAAVSIVVACGADGEQEDRDGTSAIWWLCCCGRCKFERLERRRRLVTSYPARQPVLSVIDNASRHTNACACRVSYRICIGRLMFCFCACSISFVLSGRLLRVFLLPLSVLVLVPVSLSSRNATDAATRTLIQP
jgi:hypothetical protein